MNEKYKDKEKLIREKELELENRKDSLKSLEIEKVKIETEMKDLKENIYSSLSKYPWMILLPKGKQSGRESSRKNK